MISKQAYSTLQAYEKIKIFDINRKVNPKGRLKKNYYNFTSGLLSNKVKKERRTSWWSTECTNLLLYFY